MDLLRKKTQLLQLYYPDYSADVLRDILASCNGDVDQARVLIEGPKHQKLTGQIQRTLPVKAKRKLEVTATPLPLSLALVVAPENAKKRQITNRLPQITLNTPEDVEVHLGGYALLYVNFFPKELANDLLNELTESKHKFKYRQFYLFGNLCQLDVLVAPFAARDNDCPTVVYNGLPVQGGDSPGPHEYTRHFELAAKYLEEKMNKSIIPLNPRLPYQRNDKWSAEFCVANMYEKLSNHLDWHSDRLSYIGPHNYIASVLLGLTRVFKLRSTHKPSSPVYLVPLPHNSLFLMKPGCQEEFKHTLGPMGKLLLLHPQVGTLRFSLTFRHYPADFIRNLPRCRCDLPMMLRRAFKSPETKGFYFWLCENVYQNKDCGTFHWADFNNHKDHFVAKSQDLASRWIAPE